MSVVLAAPAVADAGDSGYDCTYTQASQNTTLTAGSNTITLTMGSSPAHMIYVYGTLTTNATVSNRIVVFRLLRGGLTDYATGTLATVVASSTANFAGVNSPGGTYGPTTNAFAVPDVVQLGSTGESAAFVITAGAAGDVMVTQWAYCSQSLAHSVTVSGTVGVSNYPATQAVSIAGTIPVHEQGTAAISGAITCSSGCSGTGSGACPVDSTTTTTSSTTTTTTAPLRDATGPCKVSIAGFTGNGTAIPVAFGVLVFFAAVGMVLSMRRGAA